MWLSAAASTTPSAPDSQTAIILGIVTLLSAVLVAIIAGVFQVLSSKAGRVDPSPPSPSGLSDVEIHERVAILEHRADAKDEADDVRDRRLDVVEDRLDLDNPRWHERR